MAVQFRDFFIGAELIWAGWLLLVVIWIVWTRRFFRGLSLRRARRLAKDERGVSYTLAFVFTCPVYLTLCCLIFETSMLLMTKIGTVYSAYAGARAAATWEAMQPGLRDERVRQAAAMALASIVSTGNLSEDAGPAALVPDEKGLPANAEQQADQYVAALEAFSRGAVDREKLRRHYLRVAARTSVTVEIPKKVRGGDVTVTVEYRAPFIIPGIAKILDPDHTAPYEMPIRTTVTLNLEYPVSANGTVGIDYRSY